METFLTPLVDSSMDRFTNFLGGSDYSVKASIEEQWLNWIFEQC